MKTLNNFDKIAKNYDQTIPAHILEHYLTKRLKLIKDYFPINYKMLDLGCGTGKLAEKLINLGYKVVGIDQSEGMLEIAKKRGIEIYSANSENLPFLDEEFDGVYSIAVFHHLYTKEKVAKTISEMIRVTKSGGIILIWDHNLLNPYWPIIMKKVPQDSGEERIVPISELLSNLKLHKYKELKIFYLGFIPDFIPQKLLNLFQFLEKIVEALPLINKLSAHNVIIFKKR